MGRPPSNGGPSFRFNQSEIAEMEAILQAHKTAMPAHDVLVSLAEKFSKSEERSGKIEVQMKQVWNWFQNRRYAIRAKAAKSPGKLNITQITRDDSAVVKAVPQPTQPLAASSATVRPLPQAPQHPTVPSAAVRTFLQAPQHPAAFSGRVADNSQMEYEAKSARDGAWYDVSTFLSHRSLETGDPEVLVRFAGFGAEEDEWVNVRKNVRQRSLPCESSECVAVLPADLILCFQEGKEQALYFDAHVLDAQRRRHDVRGCRCRFLVRYDHDQSEEIVALRKICRRPETDYRLQQLHAVNDANQKKNGANNSIHTVSTLRVYPPAQVQPKQHKVEPPSPPEKRQRLDSALPAPLPEVSQKQFKVEPVLPAPPGVPLNQQRLQPPPVLLVEPQKVEPTGPCASLEPKKVETMVSVPSAQGSAEAPPHSDVVQPVMLGEVSVEPHKEESLVPCSGEAKQETQAVETSVVVALIETPEKHLDGSGEGSQELQAVGTPLTSASEEHLKAEAAPSSQVGDAVLSPAEVVVEPQKEAVVSGSTVSELHEVEAAVADQPHTSELEPKTKAEEAVVPKDTNVVEPAAIEAKPEEPVPINDTKAVEAEAEAEAATEARAVVPVPANEANVAEAENAALTVEMMEG